VSGIMAMPDFEPAEPSPQTRATRAERDPRALRILAKSIYRELRAGGLSEGDVMAVSGELLHFVALDMKDRRLGAASGLDDDDERDASSL
jgi:hypothetical protein